MIALTTPTDIFLTPEYMQRPLVCAALNGHEQMVNILLEQDEVDLDQVDYLGQSPL